jgi:hypothetical protein
MNRIGIALAIVIAGCGDNIPVPGPGDVPPIGKCAIRYPGTGPILPTNQICPRSPGACVNNTDTSYACSCDETGTNYAGGFPDGVFDANSTLVCDVEGCTSPSYDACRLHDLIYAFPDCAFTAEVSGVVGGDLESHECNASNSDSDGDTTWSMCPDGLLAMRPDPFVVPQDIRDSGDFNDLPQVVGGIHIEEQSCRYYAGSYDLPDVGHPVPAGVEMGDLISTAGDWIVDEGHLDCSECFPLPSPGCCRNPPHAEIHEARVTAKTVGTQDPNKFYVLLNAFFTAGTRQESSLVLDVEVPKPTPKPSTPPKCEFMDNAGRGANGPDPRFTGCAMRDDVKAIGLAGNLNFEDFSGYGFCHVELVSDHTAADGSNIPPNDIKCTGGDADTLPGICGYTGPVLGGRAAPGVEGGDNMCAPIAFAGTMQATWDPPGDLYLCDCECDDPSRAGATMDAVIQGCASADAVDATAICDQACGGVVCTGASPSCDIGACHPKPESVAPSLVASSVCDPDHQPFVRVAPEGDYRTDVDPATSNVIFTISGNTTSPVPINGAVHFNISGGSPRIVEFSDIDLRPNDFSFKGQTVRNAAITESERVYGEMFSGNAFEVPPGIGVFAVRAILNGDPAGVNVVNTEAVTGSIDFSVSPPKFSLDVQASDVQEGVSRHMVAHIDGAIDDLPPHANVSRTATRVECTSPSGADVTLDGTASVDSDPGDFISHYQWFEQLQGIGNSATTHIVLPLAHPESFTLHVYDRELGSSMQSTTVTVVDTTPPSIAVSPSVECLWPPNHGMRCFDLGRDIQVATTDTCDPKPVVKVVSVVSNQPDDGTGDGDTAGDVTWTDTRFCVRSERAATLGERTYTVTVQASDHSGNASTANVTVDVPLSGACHALRGP